MPIKLKGVLGATVACAIAYVLVNAMALGVAANYVAVPIIGVVLGALIGLSCATIFAQGNKLIGGPVTAAVIWGLFLVLAAVGGNAIGIADLGPTLVVIGLGFVAGLGYKVCAR